MAENERLNAVVLFPECFSQLGGNIRYPEPLALRLYVDGIIEHSTFAKVLTVGGLSTCAKACAILENVQDHLELSPRLISAVLDILRDTHSVPDRILFDLEVVRKTSKYQTYTLRTICSFSFSDVYS